MGGGTLWCMATRPSTHAQVVKQLDGVAKKLGSAKLKGPDRLALLRQQAALGDLRDAIAERARRSS